MLCAQLSSFARAAARACSAWRVSQRSISRATSESRGASCRSSGTARSAVTAPAAGYHAGRPEGVQSGGGGRPRRAAQGVDGSPLAGVSLLEYSQDLLRVVEHTKRLVISLERSKSLRGAKVRVDAAGSPVWAVRVHAWCVRVVCARGARECACVVRAYACMGVRAHVVFPQMG